MARIKTEWAVVALVAAARKRTDETLAVTAKKTLARLVSLAAPRIALRWLILWHAPTGYVRLPPASAPQSRLLIRLLRPLIATNRSPPAARARLLILPAFRLVAPQTSLPF